MKQKLFRDEFTGTDIHSHWTQTIIGNGSLTQDNNTLRMSLQPVTKGTYADAQIDDYGKLARALFPWQPPLRMELRARSSHPAATVESQSGQKKQQIILKGTAGFGFWNYPFSVRGDLLMLPEAVWFFYASPPSDMALVPAIPGFGWKAQIVHSMRPSAALAALPTALSIGWGKLTGQYQSAARWIQTLSGADETIIPAQMTDWHTYRLEWYVDEARFWLDQDLILIAHHPPTRALGFVAWLDNQYAIATPRGRLHFGTLDCQEQWLEISSLHITSL